MYYNPEITDYFADFFNFELNHDYKLLKNLGYGMFNFNNLHYYDGDKCIYNLIDDVKEILNVILNDSEREYLVIAFKYGVTEEFLKFDPFSCEWCFITKEKYCEFRNIGIPLNYSIFD